MAPHLRVRASSVLLSLLSVRGFLLFWIHASVPLLPQWSSFSSVSFPQMQLVSTDTSEWLGPGQACEAARDHYCQVCAGMRLSLCKPGSECLLIFCPLGTSLTLVLALALEMTAFCSFPDDLRLFVPLEEEFR